MSFCGWPNTWWGGCCMKNATGNLSASECGGRGCDGYHCCVSTDAKDITDEDQRKAIGVTPQAAPVPTQPTAPAATQPKPSDTGAQPAEKPPEMSAEEWGEQPCPGKPNIKRRSELCPATQEAEKVEQPEQAAAKCEVCGQSKNCCSAGGSWFGQCPTVHTYEEGHAVCKDAPDVPPETNGDTTADNDARGDEPCPGKPNIKRRSEHCPAADTDAEGIDEEDISIEPEEPPATNEGVDCFQDCDKTPGHCDSFCGKPGLWSGLCCKKGATGNLSAAECHDQGCIGYHCCVSVPWSGKSEDASGAKKPPALKPNPNAKYVKPEWSAEDLADIFKGGKPSNDLEKAGLLVHGFDGTELDADHKWMPCVEGFCKGASKWWSTSLINRVHSATWGDNGLILSPSRTKMLCSHTCDFGSLYSGCKASAPNGYQGKGIPFPKGHLKEMLERSMYEPGLTGAYNEVLIDMVDYQKNLPQAVAAFYYKGNAKGMEIVAAAHAYVTFLDAFNLTAASVPLIKFNANMSGGQAMQDVSGGARGFLQKHKYSTWRENWDQNHPYLSEHPEKMPRFVREQSARRGEHVPVREYQTNGGYQL